MNKIIKLCFLSAGFFLVSHSAQAKQKQSLEIESKAQKLAIQLEADPSLLPNMVMIQGGTFQMGGAKGETDETPVHMVSIPPFKMASTETMQKLWLLVTGNNPSVFTGKNRPVENVSWDEIQEFLAILNAATNQNFRLPSESEWEYAARAGSKTKYSWGNKARKNKANYDADRDTGTKIVGSYKSNKFGLYDMHGNVWEWVQDCYHNSYDDAPNDGSPRKICNTEDHVLRSGSWNVGAHKIRSSYRDWDNPSERFTNNGFRLAQSSKK